MKLLIAVVLMLAEAQSAIPVLNTDHIAFDMAGNSLATVQGWMYRAYVGARPPISLTVACAVTGTQFSCQFPVSALSLTATPQLLALTAAETAVTAETAKSAGMVLALASPQLPAAISALPVAITPGGSVQITITNSPALGCEWVGLYTPGATNLVDWRYLSGNKTECRPSPTAAFAFPAANAGVYEFRFHATNVDAAGNYPVLAISNRVTVSTTTTPPPPSCTLSASPTTIIRGAAVTLGWTSANAASISINQSVGSVTPVISGSRSVSPLATTNYTATATATGGATATCAAAVTVTLPPAPGVLRGETVTLPNGRQVICVFQPTAGGVSCEF